MKRKMPFNLEKKDIGHALTAIRNAMSRVKTKRKFIVAVTSEKQIQYEVQAKTEEEAKEKAQSGECPASNSYEEITAVDVIEEE